MTDFIWLLSIALGLWFLGQSAFALWRIFYALRKVVELFNSLCGIHEYLTHTYLADHCGKHEQLKAFLVRLEKHAEAQKKGGADRVA